MLEDRRKNVGLREDTKDVRVTKEEDMI